jgi:hypothetical protein
VHTETGRDYSPSVVGRKSKGRQGPAQQAVVRYLVEVKTTAMAGHGAADSSDPERGLPGHGGHVIRRLTFLFPHGPRIKDRPLVASDGQQIETMPPIGAGKLLNPP